MQRHELLQLMATLQLSGMRAAFDEIVADGLRRQHAFDQMLGALLQAEVAEKRARSIRLTLLPNSGPVGKVPTDLEGCDDEADEAAVFAGVQGAGGCAPSGAGGDAGECCG
jgi:hypothetical protein